MAWDSFALLLNKTCYSGLAFIMSFHREEGEGGLKPSLVYPGECGLKEKGNIR